MKSFVFSLLLLLFFTIFPLNLQATAQFPDILIYEGKTLDLFSNPLESYFSKKHPKPAELLRAKCTANWRGYVATWKIENGFLFLTEVVEGSCNPNAKSIFSKIFPNQKAPIQATWFTGTLRVPQGKELDYVHMGYESTYEEDLFLEIKNGELVKATVVKNNPVTP